MTKSGGLKNPRKAADKKFLLRNERAGARSNLEQKSHACRVCRFAQVEQLEG
jgi:hypothetical protein